MTFNIHLETTLGGKVFGHRNVKTQISDVIHYFGQTGRFDSAKIWGKTIKEAMLNDVLGHSKEWYIENYIKYEVVARNADFALQYFTQTDIVQIRLHGEKEAVISAIKKKVKKEDFYLPIDLNTGADIPPSQIYAHRKILI